VAEVAAEVAIHLGQQREAQEEVVKVKTTVPMQIKMELQILAVVEEE
jgi:hypothetical protein